MAQLRHDYQEFSNRDAEVIILGPDNAAAFKRIWDMEDMPMPGLSDQGSKVADIYLQEVNLLKLGRMPALVIVDKQGIMQYIHHSKSMSDIPTNSTLFEILDSLNH